MGLALEGHEEARVRVGVLRAPAPVELPEDRVDDTGAEKRAARGSRVVSGDERPAVHVAALGVTERRPIFRRIPFSRELRREMPARARDVAEISEPRPRPAFVWGRKAAEALEGPRRSGTERDPAIRADNGVAIARECPMGSEESDARIETD